MEESKKNNFKFKSTLLLVFAALIVISFVFLKIKDLYQEKVEIVHNDPLIEDEDSSIYSSEKSGLIKKFESLDHLSSFINENRDEYSNFYNKDSRMMLESVASDEFSGTNIQVEGVDEADIIKTDGEYIYAVYNRSLYIIKAYPAEDSKILNTVPFDDNLIDIYIQGDKLVVFGEKSDFSKAIDSRMIWPSVNSTFLKVFDMSDKENLVELRSMEMEGSLFNSRLIGNHLYFIVNNYNYYGNDSIVPKITYQSKDLNINNSDIYYFDTDYSFINFSSIISVDLENNELEPRSSFYLLPGNQNMYVSQNNIYITYTKYLNEYEIESDILLDLVYPRLSEKDREVIDEINSISNKILSLGEKKAKLRQIIDSFIMLLNPSEKEELEQLVSETIINNYPNIEDELEQTVIYKLAIFNSLVEPVAEAFVSGSVLNQFSMDEHNGLFRIATTKNASWSKYTSNNNSYSNLYVLDEDLVVLGEIKNLAPEERIYSVRFIGEKAFVVTFKQVDPLFSIDLSNPYNPKVLGELKIPGFSNYLHPYDENMLIGFGQDVNPDNARIEALKLSLFDISSDDPRELDNYIIGDSESYSLALYEHKAFLFSRDKNILVIPYGFNKENFDGFLVFEIIDEKILLKGKINHGSNSKRSLYIENYLYSFSDRFLKINNINDLSELKTLEL